MVDILPTNHTGRYDVKDTAYYFVSNSHMKPLNILATLYSNMCPHNFTSTYEDVFEND